MWLLEAIGIPFNPADGTVILPLWVAGALLALAVILLLVAVMRAGAAGTLASLALVGFAGWAVWAWSGHQQALERQSIASKVAALEAQAFMPGSVLGCLGARGLGAIDAACESAIFASGESAATAVSYTAARLDLLDQAAALADERDGPFEARLSRLRQNLEQDRFGLVSHVMSSRPDCTAERCAALRLFRDPERLRANLRDNVFAAHVARAETRWNSKRGGQQGAYSDEPAREHTAAAATPAAPLPPGYTLPSADSIPPVSIMTAEPPSTAPAPAAAPPAATPTPPPRPARAQRPPQPQQRTAPPPQETVRGLPAPPRIQ